MKTEEQALRRAADMFHEILSAHSAHKLLVRPLNEVMREKLQAALRSNDQICEIAADGFEVCVRALAELGAKDVSIHECGEADLEVW
jgi:hypothetical protein